jgi:hypothetical protein
LKQIEILACSLSHNESFTALPSMALPPRARRFPPL